MSSTSSSLGLNSLDSFLSDPFGLKKDDHKMHQKEHEFESKADIIKNDLSHGDVNAAVNAATAPEPQHAGSLAEMNGLSSSLGSGMMGF